MTEQSFIQLGNQIRFMLLEEFPENPCLKNQCKRASILIDLYCKKNNISCTLLSGHINKDGDLMSRERGHVWSLITFKGETYVFDLTLVQFNAYLDRQVPPVIFSPVQEAYLLYAYKADRFGEYTYHISDIRPNLVQKLDEIKPL